MTSGQKFSMIIRIATSFIVFCVAIFVIFSERILGPDSAITYIMNGDWVHGPNYFAVVAFAVVVLTVMILASILSGFISFVIRNMDSRVETIGRLLLSIIKYGSVLFSIFYGLSLLGISTAGLVTSAGIMSIVIGLGAQSLIGDILAGIFIVFEGAFRVGDIVTVGDFRGNVVDIGLRTTKIENVSGDIKIFNNSSIAGILNMTRKASTALCQVQIDYSADLKYVERTLSEAFPKIREKYALIIDGPKYLGVSELGESGVMLKICASCIERDRPTLERILNREVLLLFQEKGINIPFPQVVMTPAEDVPPTVDPEKEYNGN